MCDLIEIAQIRRDWPATERHAYKLLEEFPDENMAVWAIVHSRLSRGDGREAWRVIVNHDAEPVDKDTALWFIAACQATEPPAPGAERLLDIASEFAHDEDVAAAALSALLVNVDATQMTANERARFTEALNSHFEKFDEGQVLRRFSCGTVEDLVETMESLTAAPSIEQVQAVSVIRLGQAPYGLLRCFRMLPYAELLVALPAGHLTAVSLDDEERASERDAAMNSLGGVVAADTSVAAVAVHAGIAIEDSAAHFKRVLIADDLVTDARHAVVNTSVPVAGVAINDPLAGGLRLADVEEQHMRLRDNVARVADILQQWRSVSSGGIVARWDDGTSRPNAVGRFASRRVREAVRPLVRRSRSAQVGAKRRDPHIRYLRPLGGARRC